MGYTTDFKGEIHISPKLSEELENDLNTLYDSNSRNWNKHEEFSRFPRPSHEGYCQWELKNNSIVWDGGEKFYNYVEWLEYIIKYIESQEPNTYSYSGQLLWQGEEIGDIGKIYITENSIVVSVLDMKKGLFLEEKVINFKKSA